MLWSIFVIYIITYHELGGLSGIINGLIAAAIGAFSMLMSEPTAKSNVKSTRSLNRDITCGSIVVFISLTITQQRPMKVELETQLGVVLAIRLLNNFMTKMDDSRQSFTENEHPSYMNI